MASPDLQVVALVDGFNLYHDIRQLGDQRLKWCDVSELVRQLLRPGERLAQTRYYTANPVHLGKDVRERHTQYVAAVQARGGESLVVERGHFKEKTVEIHFSNGKGVSLRVRNKKAHEEKETDVRIAVDMMDIAMQADNRSERLTLALVSGDSDQRPAIERVLARFPSVSVLILPPPFQKAAGLRTLEEQWPGRVRISKIKRDHIEKSRMPDSFAANGQTHQAPKKYRDNEAL